MDSREEEIAALKARLSGLENNAASPTTGFTRGFFGCFGVAGAVILVIGGVALFGALVGPPKSQPATAEPPPATDVEAGHCVAGLTEAQELRIIDGDKSALIFPWEVTRLDSVNDDPVYECRATDQGRSIYVTVQQLCGDEDNVACTRLVRVRDLDGERYPTPKR